VREREKEREGGKGVGRERLLRIGVIDAAAAGVREREGGRER